jgi:hypothetical protein
MRRIFACGVVLGLLAAGCLSDTRVVPTASSLEMAQTAQYLTQNAPPPGFEHGVQFPRIDDNLSRQPSWRYTVMLTFDGVYADTQEKATGSVSAEIFGNELSGERRVILKATGAAFGAAERNVEAVRISNDYYLVDQNKVCAKVTDSPADRKVADLTAGDLIGGVKNAVPLGERKTVGDFQVWEYTFLPNDVVVPAIALGEGGKMSIAAGDLWVAPSRNAVYEYTITLKVDNAIMQGNRQLTGQVHAAYKLIETGVPYNIAIPNGC